MKFVDSPEDEKDVLKWFKEKLKGCKLIITWNGDNFDIPFLLTRSVILDEELQELTKIRSLDLCRFCKEKFSMAKYSLVEVSRSLGIKKPDEINWKSMSALYLNAVRGDEKAKANIIEHCTSDLFALKKIFEKIKVYIPFNLL